MLVIGPKDPVQSIKKKILNIWKNKNLRKVNIFIEFQIERNRAKRTLQLHQTLYTTKLLQHLEIENSNPTKIPFPANTILKKGPEKNQLTKDNIIVYQQIVGSAIYLANYTRPNISYCIGQLARFISKPSKTHYQFAKHILRYFNKTKTIEILYQNKIGEKSSL